jgi:hypothetical protein
LSLSKCETWFQSLRFFKRNLRRYSEEGKFTESFEKYQKALIEDPLHCDAYVARGAGYVNQVGLGRLRSRVFC